MTREEEIREKEITQAAESKYFVTKAEEFAWIHGAKWADKNLRKGLWDAEKVEKVLGNLLFNKEEKIYRAYLDYDAFFEDFRKAMEG